jgi:hypothetical protein
MTGDPLLPPFLHGTFDWRFNGLQWNTPPPFDLLSDRVLHDPSPWVVIASVVERAKRGDHSEVSRLCEFFERHQPVALGRIALLVFADTAPGGSLHRLGDALRSADPRTRVFAAEAAALTGSLRLIPDMLEAWERARTLNDHEAIGFALSEVLESKPSPIAESVGSYDLAPPEQPVSPAAAAAYKAMVAAYGDVDPPELPQHVRDALRTHEAAHGANAVLWKGVLYEIRAVAQELLDIARGQRTHVIYNLRHRFEAFTGIDCRPMLHALRLQPLSIATIIEQFELSGEVSKYRAGVRYFWGHSIPD